MMLWDQYKIQINQMDIVNYSCLYVENLMREEL